MLHIFKISFRDKIGMLGRDLACPENCLAEQMGSTPQASSNK